MNGFTTVTFLVVYLNVINAIDLVLAL